MYPAIRDNLDQLLTLNPLTKQKYGKCPTKSLVKRQKSTCVTFLIRSSFTP